MLPVLQQAPPLTDVGAPTGVLPVANGGWGDAGTAWSSTTPTVVSGTGALTTVSCVVKRKTVGKTTFLNVDVTITTNGTGATNIQVPLPVTALNACVISGMDSAASLKMLAGRIGAGGTTLIITFYDGTYPGASGAGLRLSGVIETT